MDVNKLLEVLTFISPEHKLIFIVYCCIGAYLFMLIHKLSKIDYNIEDRVDWKEYFFVGLIMSSIIIIFGFFIFDSYFSCIYAIGILSFLTFTEVPNKTKKDSK